MQTRFINVRINYCLETWGRWKTQRNVLIVACSRISVVCLSCLCFPQCHNGIIMRHTRKLAETGNYCLPWTDMWIMQSNWEFCSCPRPMFWCFDVRIPQIKPTVVFTVASLRVIRRVLSTPYRGVAGCLPPHIWRHPWLCNASTPSSRVPGMTCT